MEAAFPPKHCLQFQTSAQIRAAFDSHRRTERTTTRPAGGSQQRCEMKKSKLLGAVLAAAVCFSSVATTPASAGFSGFYFPKKFFFHKKFIHKKFKYKIKMKHRGGGGSNAAVVWTVIGCAGGVVLAALAANARDHRELTADEAASCGLLFLFSQPR
jgi:hypothetical protein